ncbi:MAG: hypothetical protein JW934_24690 [Anaerolineae bacterium]|nr:hypothetical protein [Anaerolineae bacterium]
MTRPLTLDTVVDALAEQAQKALARQITDVAHPNVGACVSEAFGIAEPASAVSLIAACGFLYLVQRDDFWLERARLGIDYMLRAQHSDGLIDLISCNYDSAPDTGFAVQRLCPLIELGRGTGLAGEQAGRDSRWTDFSTQVEAFVRRAVPGMLTGGFHTPNHRWAISSALAWAAHLCPDLDVDDTVAAYLAEGFDVDQEGAFIERSVGVYDAVCDRSLLLLHTLWQAPGALGAVQANLDLDLHLLHADGTAETGLSRRQDLGTRTVPLGLAAPYLWAAHLLGEARFAAAAQFLWTSATSFGLDDLNWLLYALLRLGEPDGELKVVDALPNRFTRYLPLNGIWRVRDGPFSATLFRGSTRLLTLVYGQAELCGLSASQSYFGVGQFVGDSLEVQGDVTVLRSEGMHRPHRPGYDLPLGRPVPPPSWHEIRLQGDYRPLPPCASELHVRQIDGGLELHYRSLDGVDGVAAQVALDFPPGGVWETGDVCTSTHAGQAVFLKQGYGTMRYGTDAIRVGPGVYSHRTWQMRDVPLASDRVRVLFTFRTPIDYVFTITCDQQIAAL